MKVVWEFLILSGISEVECRPEVFHVASGHLRRSWKIIFRTSTLAAFPWAQSNLAQIIFTAWGFAGYCGLLLKCMSHKCKQPFVLYAGSEKFGFCDWVSCHARVAVGSWQAKFNHLCWVAEQVFSHPPCYQTHISFSKMDLVLGTSPEIRSYPVLGLVFKLPNFLHLFYL